MGNRSFLWRVLPPAICSLFFLYLSHQLLAYASFPPWITVLIAAWIFGLIFGLLFIIVRVWMNPKRRESRSAGFLSQFTNFAQEFLSYALFLVVVRDLAFLILLILGKSFFFYDQDEAVFILLAPFAMMLLGRISVWTGPWKKTVKLESDDVPKALDGLKIVQISDLHIGPGISLNKVKEVVTKTNAMNADLIALTGDIVDHREEKFIAEIKELQNLKSKYGTFYVPGNHEYYWGLNSIVEMIRGLGIHTVLNANHILRIGDASLAVCGVTDLASKGFSMPEPDYQKALQGAENCNYKILLSHQPKTADEATKFGFNLQLSGHTHGGQFIPWSLVIRLFQKYTTGLFQVGKMKLYVSRGTGHWGPPDRLGTYSEITEITLLQK